MGLRKDIWRPLIVDATPEAIIARGGLAGLPVHWLPPMGSFQFLADPFGIWREDKLHVFIETYDYRVRSGAIEVLVFSDSYDLIERRRVLSEPWHLSYPLIIEAEGETWMLPEAHRSGRLTLYRAVDFPYRWEPAHVIVLDHVPVDATPIFHDGLWWLFYTSASNAPDKMAALHVAFAERLAGPWRPHPNNPVRVDAGSSRPGGTARIIDGRIMLPAQDCRSTYGSAIRPLYCDVLTTADIALRMGERLTAPPEYGAYVEGCTRFPPSANRR